MKMKSIVTVSLSALLGAAFIGCDEKIAEKKTVETKPDGTTVTDKQTVTKEADGDVVAEKKRDVDRPGIDRPNDDTKVKVKVEEK
jgi:hypothetical protein